MPSWEERGRQFDRFSTRQASRFASIHRPKWPAVVITLAFILAAVMTFVLCLFTPMSALGQRLGAAIGIFAFWAIPAAWLAIRHGRK